MPLKIDGRVYYRTAEVCQIVGIGGSTIFRRIRQHVIQDAEYRDRKGWRLSTDGELLHLKWETDRTQTNHVAEM